MTRSPATTPLYRPLDGVVVRAPLLPASVFAASGAELDRWVADPEFRFAVTVASADLTAAVDRPMGAAPAARAALQRYLIRAATRPTPFGGFAAVGLARWADCTDLAVGAGRRRTRTRPDLGWLTGLALQLSADPALRPRLRLYANRCVFEHEGRYHLTDPGTGGVRNGPDVSVRATPVVRRVLALARAPIGREELRRAVATSHPGAGDGRADEVLDLLAERQFLLPEVLPTLTGDPLAWVGAAVERALGTPPSPAAAPPDPAGAWCTRLRAVADECHRVDTAEPAEAAAALTGLSRRLATVADDGPRPPDQEPDPEAGAHLQVDSALTFDGSGLARSVAVDAATAVDLLFRLHPDPLADPLAGYRSAFHQRYGERRVGLLELLDPRFGLGPPSGYVGAAGDHGRSGERTAALQELVAESIRTGCAGVELDDALVDRLSMWTPAPAALPPSVELSAFLAASSRRALDLGRYLLVVGPNLGAQAAGRGLGRFADLLGPCATGLLTAAADAEQAVTGAAGPTAPVVAELVYRPLRARSANVAVRPVVRCHELPVGVAPTLPPDRVVGVDEVSVAVQDGRFRLWWDREDRPLVLAEGHMLNPAGAPPLCRSMLELSGDGTTWLSPFDWGPLAGMPFLPRVRRGRVVLSPAQWRLGPPTAGAAGTTSSEPSAWIEHWRERWHVPRLVHLTSADNRLLLDLDDPGHRAHLVAAVRAAGRRPVYLQEGLPAPEDAWLPGPRGRHVVELVVPLVRTAARPGPPSPPVPSAIRHPAGARRRPPGSEWLYLVLEGPRRTEDALLTGPLGALAQGLVDRGDADGWFFVRYADPAPQLRLRLHGQGEALVDRALPELTRWAVTAIGSGVRTRLTVEPYDRELERYGGPETTAICERLACADSTAVRGLLTVLAGPAPAAPDPLELALVSFADLLGCLTGANAAAATRWARELAAGTSAAGPLFRRGKDRLRALLGAVDDGAWAVAGEPWDRIGASVGTVLTRRRESARPLVTALAGCAAGGSGTRSVEQMAGDVLHLHANRLGLDRSQEQCVLGLLDRTLRSLTAFPRPATAGTEQPGGPP
ncbi:thiopeptide-type bacteriocin biosynthesis domain-containing protein [Modestobacter sp. DSM 44400]|uniref:lantibiotic dehydratase n=1 Tax=Modestobacter sp. DSM 44400 TaxID=1550230 RepID=UPI000899CDFE|nr:lantibiotic dehydratase [Modestobacter sp. DSM 44400]SDY55057.1 thiopeptide-type bacteriocin biosynthesis domain-containing protein [Modestobacter sp. DSM 44400]